MACREYNPCKCDGCRDTPVTDPCAACAACAAVKFFDCRTYYDCGLILLGPVPLLGELLGCVPMCSIDLCKSFCATGQVPAHLVFNK